MKEVTLGKENYREYAKRAMDKYAEKGMMIDALLWGGIIGHYESRIKELEGLLIELSPAFRFDSDLGERIRKAVGT